MGLCGQEFGVALCAKYVDDNFFDINAFARMQHIVSCVAEAKIVPFYLHIDCSLQDALARDDSAFEVIAHAVQEYACFAVV